jgi:uncharacterized membrane protein YozB (DUF420 family)
MKSAIFTLVTSMVVFFTPIAPLMMIVAGFIVADTLIGVFKAVIKKQGFTSHKLSRLIFKMFFYQVVILLLYPIDVFIIASDLFGQPHFFTKVGTFVLIFVEALSIEENIKALNKERGFQFYFNKLMATVKKGKQEITDIKKTL